jgi:outer membrane lipoprotein carrier protein
MIIFRSILLCYFTVFQALAFDFHTVDTYKANFSQTITNPSGKEILYSGEIFIKKPLKILWRYSEPIQKDVYLIDDRVIIIEPDLEQAIISKLDKQINILQVLQDGEKIDTNRYKAILHNRPYIYTIKENQLSSISYKDEVDNQVNIHFTHIAQNSNLSDTTFDFDIPPYFDIIRK